VALDEYVAGLKYDDKGLLVAIAQDVDTGAVLMQAFANAEAVKATLRTRLGTFYSRSRQSLWCKGDTSGHYLHVKGVYVDCDKDSLIYQCKPVGPACHTGAPTCWFEKAGFASSVEALADEGEGGTVSVTGDTPLTTLEMLQKTIADREAEARGEEDGSSGEKKKKSWTAKLLSDEALLCAKVREEAGELCETLEKGEGRERCASEAADLIYHTMVLLRKQGVDSEEVMEVLRNRFGTSGIDEKAARKK